MMSKTNTLYLALCCCLVMPSLATRGQLYKVTDEEQPQKSYEEDEEGKLLPTRTFLTPLEITLLCVLVVLVVFLLVFCCLYLYCFGCRCPNCTGCCRRSTTNKDEYSQVQLHRERKIGEIWKTNYPPPQSQHRKI